MTRVTVEVPSIPFPGGSTDAMFYRSAADHLRHGYAVGGSNLTASVIRLLENVGAALEGPEPDEVATWRHTLEYAATALEGSSDRGDTYAASQIRDHLREAFPGTDPKLRQRYDVLSRFMSEHSHNLRLLADDLERIQ